MHIDLEMDAAKAYCEMVQVEWPAKEPVIWFETPKSEGDWDWRVTPHRVPPVVDEEVGSMLCKTFFLSALRSRVLALSKEDCLSVSPYFVELDNVWPKGTKDIKKLCIPPSSSAKEVTIIFASMVKTMWRDESLVVCGFPLSHDFYINVLYTFGHLFEKVGLVNPNSTSSTCTIFLFNGFQRWELAYEQIVSYISMKVDNQNLLDFRLSLRGKGKNLYGSIFYSFCLYMNCIHIRKQVLDIVLRMKQPPKFEAQTAVQDHVADNQSCGTCCSGCDSKRSLRKPTDKPRRESLSSDEGHDKWLTFAGTCPHLDLVRKPGRSLPFYGEVIKFCTSKLLSEWQLLCREMKSSLKLTDESLREGTCLTDGSDIRCASPKKYSWSTSMLQVKRLDFGMELWMNIEHHIKYQRQTLQLVLNVLENTAKCECLEIRGLPLLSDFSVSLVYVLAHIFEKVRFYHTSVGRNVILFFNFRSFPVNLKEGLQESINEIEHVTSLVPLKNLFSKEFYEKIKNVNNSSLQKQCLYVSQFLSGRKN